MKIVVFVKQVPDNTKLKPEQLGSGSLPKEGVDMMINPFDEYGLETALRLKEAAGGDSTVTILSLGSASAKEIVKKAIAAGADSAFLLSDETLLAGDNAVTAQALAQGVKNLVPDFNLLIFGQQALDDAAGQTGPMVAEILNLPSLTLCKNAALAGDSAVKITRETERGNEVQELTLPGVLSMMKCDYELRTANIKGVMKANKTDIPVKSGADIGLDAGLAKAATVMSNVRQRPAKQGGVKLEGVDAATAAKQLVSFLKEEAKVL